MSGARKPKPSWIRFLAVGASPSGKTLVWHVNTADSKKIGIHLGHIGWFYRWRKYAFFPEVDMVFEQDCLRDIAEFCESKTKEHRAVRTVTDEPVRGARK